MSNNIEISLPTFNPYSSGQIYHFDDGSSYLDREPVEYVARDTDRIHHVMQGETLTDIAFKYYVDPKLYYLIADVNNLQNVLELETGLVLTIPDLEQIIFS